MNLDLLIISSILIIGFGIVIYLITKKQNSKSDATLVEWLKSMDKRLDTNSSEMNAKLNNAASAFASVQKSLGEMSEIGRNMKDLQEFLNSPKLRGNIGEQVLKELLGQFLPKNTYRLQYRFKTGSIVDAVIITGGGIIPIDSKFPMENFRRISKATDDKEKKLIEREFISDIKRHIDSISSKYILTNEGTIDFALMYVPSESVYYEIANEPSLYDHATKKRVLAVSPMTFYAFLRSILIGFEGQKISQQAHKILSNLRSIQKEYEKTNENLETLSRHVSNSYNMMTQVSTSFGKLGQQITTTNELGEVEEKEIKQLES
ncbi:MAG: DNA recombination protein RmuC [Candidatus Levybacteria bacterium]|nr:DNA recombination protein RmuC [Candidatus Levybacteria bacterium]